MLGTEQGAWLRAEVLETELMVTNDVFEECYVLPGRILVDPDGSIRESVIKKV